MDGVGLSTILRSGFFRGAGYLSPMYMVTGLITEIAVFGSHQPLAAQTTYQATVAILAVLGAFDLPFRLMDSFRFRHARLGAWLAKTVANGGRVTGWSTKIRLPRSLIGQFMNGMHPSGPEILEEKTRQSVPGIFRLLLRESARPAQYPVGKLGMDFWKVNTDPANPRLLVFFYEI